MRLQFLQQCQQFPRTDELKTYIVTALQRDCCRDDPRAWIAAATCHMQLKDETNVGFLKAEEEGEDEESTLPPRKKKKHNDAEDKATTTNNPVLTMMRQATRKIPTQDMYLQAIRFLVTYLEHLESQEGSLEKQKACRKLLEKLFKEASSLKDYSAALVLEHVDYLVRAGKHQAAFSRLEGFAKVNCTSAAIWIRWADLVYQHTSKRTRAIGILDQALTQIPMSATVDNMQVLLELLGAKLATAARDSWSVLERILILAPGCVQMEDVEQPAFGVKSVSDACLQFFLHTIATETTKEVRKIYQAVLFQSSLLENISSESDAACYKDFIDASIKAEKEDASCFEHEKKQRLERIFESAIKAFKDAPVGDEYRQRRDDEVRFG
jgi:tetratricopeptide (TPR) repeat protein